MFFVKWMLMAHLMTAGVSDDVAQELHILIRPQALEDVEEPLPCRPATLRDPGNRDQIVLDQHSLTLFPESALVQSVRRIPRRVSPHREQSKFDAVVPQLQFNCGGLRLHGGQGLSSDCVIARGNRHIFWSHTRDNGARVQKYGHAVGGCWNSKVGV